MLTVRARRLVLLLAALTALLLAGCGSIAPTPAIHGLGAQNRVGAFIPAAQLLAPPTTSQSSCSRPGFTASAVGIASGFCVAAEDEGPFTTPEGRPYSAHYLNDTGPVRNIPGSVVDETIDNGQVAENLPDRTVYYDPNNDVTVVESKTTGKIMSVRRGPP
jgi:hypothetical protein